MRLCFLADATDTHTRKWVSFFAGQGHEVHLISFRDAEIPDVAVHPVKMVYPVKIGAAASITGKIGYFFYLREFKGLIRAIAPDILHAHRATPYGLLGAHSGYHPFFLSVSGSDVLVFPHKSRWHRAILKSILNRADHLTATSRMLTGETRKYLKQDRKVHTIPSGVNIERFKPRAAKPANDPHLTIGVVKRLEKTAGIEYLIRAFALLLEFDPFLSLVIVGEGTEEEALKELCLSLDIGGSVRFTGFVENERIPALLNRMDMLVLPSISEAFGVTALEAAACGLPVIASNTGGLPEVVLDGETGFLVAPKKPEAIVRKAVLLIKDAGMRQRMGEAGRKFVEENYVWRKNAEEMEKLYRRVVKK
ncbi:MAG: glycosyltransferase [Candidatus Eisenbacteria bacterium]